MAEGRWVECPFCVFACRGDYAMQLHIEEEHTEDSPFAVKESVTKPPRGGEDVVRRDRADADLDNLWTLCPRPNCGEYVLVSDVDEHLEMHDVSAALESDGRENPDKRKRSDSGSGSRPRRPSVSRTDSRHSPKKLQRSKSSETRDSRSNRRGFLDYLTPTSRAASVHSHREIIRTPKEPGRLGKRELGPHAFEKEMPYIVRRALIDDAKPHSVQRIGRNGSLVRETVIDNETSGLVRLLGDLCNLDNTTQNTYLCDPSVKHVAKIYCDGNFCGYWNIQMLLSYLQRNNPHSLLPNVLQIQDAVEDAWKAGICPYGRVETGGIRGTRKWIGSHETLAYLTYTGTPVEALSFKADDGALPETAATALLDHLEAYFLSGLEDPRTKTTKRSSITPLAPVYFQRFGHSMTIVGLERKANGSRNLLVFDPSFGTAELVRKMLRGGTAYARPETLLRAYRRSEASLGRWGEFEVVVPQMQPTGSRE